MKNSKFNSKFVRFMQGRYGVDQFSKLLMVVAIVCMIVEIITHLFIFYSLGFLVMIYAYYRVLSRNFSKRYAENQWYLAKTSKIRGIFVREKAHMVIRKTHHIYTCSECKQKIKIPRGKGKIMVTCPKCHYQFSKRS